MTVSAPPPPPTPSRTAPESKPLEREEIEALVEALIEEARRETRRRHRQYWALAALVALVGAVVLVLLQRGPASHTASPALSARVGAGGLGTSRIAFLRGDPPFNGPAASNRLELDVIDGDGSGLRRLAHISGRAPVWSPDGRKLVFGKQPRRRGEACRPAGLCKDEIYVINADGTGLQRLTRNASVDGHPTWSPDGRRIAFTRDRDEFTANIYVMNADGSGQRRLTQELTRRPWVEVAWSPDWKEIAFVDSGALGALDIFVINADGSGLRNVTNTWTTSFDLAWSPDGRRIAFLDGPVDGAPLTVVNADRTGKQRLTGLLMVDLGRPSWSPDGRTIAFIGRSGVAGEAIYTVHADGTRLRKLTHGLDPEWSPDGRHIVFLSSRDDPTHRTTDLFVMNADGSGQRNLTHTPGVSEFSASWAPS